MRLTEGINMNKEIKFRAWDKEKNKMHYKFSSFWIVGETDDFNNAFTFNSANQNFILQQYIGVKDKNSKEVYEGDIVDYFDWCYASKNRKDKDTSDKEIENLLVCSDETTILQTYYPLRGIVEWDQEYLSYAPLIFSQEDFNGNSFANVCEKNNNCMDGYPKQYFEVVGNIFENPELLNNGK